MNIIIKVETLNHIISLGQKPLTLYMYFVGMSISKGECWPSYDRIQADTGLHRHAIKGAIDLLRSHKLLDVKQRFSQTTIYKPLQYAYSISANNALMEESSSAQDALMEYPISAQDALIGPPESPISALVTLKLKHKDSRKEEEEVVRGGESERGGQAPPASPDPPKQPYNYPRSPKEALQDPLLMRFKSVTDMIPGRSEYSTVIDTVQILVDRWGAALESELNKYWLAWINRTSRNGTGYRRDNLTWLYEWAVNEHIPPAPASAKSKNPKPKSFAGIQNYLDREARNGE
jgi:hypothetical protein